MGLLTRLKGLFGRQVLLPGGNMAYPWYSFENQTLATNETIFAAISMLADGLASLPLDLKQKGRKLYADEHPIAALFEYGPCPNFTTYEFIRWMETLRNVTGAAYAIKELDNAGQIDALWLMKTGNVTPRIDRDTRELYYCVRDDLTSEEVYLHNSFVVAVSHISSDGITPISPIEVLKNSLDYDRQVKEFSINQMRDGLQPRFVIKWTGTNVSMEQIQEYDEVLRTFKKSGVLYMDKGKEFTPITGNSPIDPKVFEAEKITIARVARAFSIPLDRFLPENSSYNSAEQSDLNYLRDTLLPNVRMYSQEFDKKLLSIQDRQAGIKTNFYTGGFAKADTKTRGEYYQKAIRSGWMSLDEIRELEDLPPLPNQLGKEFFISKDLVPIRQLCQESAKKEGSERDGGRV